MNKLKKHITMKNLIFLFGFVFILFGIKTSIFMLIENRSLWRDEAAFAYSFSNRGLINLVTSSLEWDQFAPVTYLYIVKVITLILGNAEITLRLFSFISYLITILFVYLFSKHILKNKYPILPASYVSALAIMLKYSNQFKPYMFDCVCVLSVFLLYYLYQNKKIKISSLTALFVLLMISSNPTCFFIGGILLVELIEKLVCKDKKEIRNILISGSVVFISFIIYYFLWLKGTATSEVMKVFWQTKKFPLIPTNKQDLVTIKVLYHDIMNHFNPVAIFVFVFFIISCIVGIIKKDKYKCSIIFGIILALFASFLEFFPVNDRLWLFIYPLLILLVFDSLDMLFSKNKCFNFIVFIICISLMITNKGIQRYTDKNNIHEFKGDDANLNITYVENNIKEDEKVYVYYYAIPVFKYKNGYTNNSIGKFKNNVIFANGSWLKYESGVEKEKFINYSNIYLLTVHIADYVKNDFYYIAKKGYLELIQYPYETALYHFSKDSKDMKTKVTYEVKKVKRKQGKYIATITIHNIGDSIINHEFEEVYLKEKQDNDSNTIINIALPKFIQQDSSIDVDIEVDFKEKDEIELQLYNSNGYWYEEKSIIIKKEMFNKK